MNAKLVVLKGAKKTTIRLRLPTVIGRSPDASVKVPSTLVSRKHCEIYRSGKELVVRDLGSVNGTYVNGERVEEPTLLFEDDLLRVGPVTMHVCLDAAAVEAPAEKPAKPREEPAAAKEEPTAKEVPAPPAGLSSILSYKETDEGSFLGIAEFDDDEEDKPAEEDPKEQQAASSAVDALKQVVEDEPPKIKGGDSALDAFFDNLD